MPKRPVYNADIMKQAIKDMNNGNLSMRAVAKKYSIPKSTLQYKIKNPGHKETFGPSSILKTKEEQKLVKWVVDMGKRGFPRKMIDVVQSVQNFLQSNPRPNPFKDNRPGPGWVKAFRRRNPQISFRASEGVTAASACVTEADIRKWFAEVEEYINENNLQEVMMNPSRIFNGDETGFQICPATGRVLAEKGSKNVYCVDKGSSKENVTVMCTFGADGTICQPMIIFPYKRIPERISQSVPEEWGLARSDSGWMTAEVFYEYVANVFHPYLLEQGVPLPIILFVDGHKSHITYDLSVLCKRLQIELIALYPNSTRILQPADVAAFSPIKGAWKNIVRQFHTDHPGEAVTKLNIASLLTKVIATIKPDTLINGFRACGLCPWSPDAVDYSKCLGSTNVKTVSNQEKESMLKTKTMSYSLFQKIVGDKILEKFKTVSRSSLEIDSLKLYNIWEYFQNKSSSDAEPTPGNTDKNIVENVSLNDSVNVNYSNDLHENQSEHFDSSEAIFDRDNPDNINAIQEQEQVSQEQLNNNVKERRQLTPEPGPSGITHSSLVKTITADSSISPFLAWPHSPKRKGKIQVERTPYALTSAKFQKIFEAKRLLQFQKEEEKKNRKKERETKKLEKERQKLTMKSKKRTNSKRIFCNICSTQIKGHQINCDVCSKVFHRSCIPASHQQHVPDDSDNDKFLCHKCYQEESDDDVLESVSDDDIEELYQLYNSEIKKL
jgi:hypothetical protein